MSNNPLFDDFLELDMLDMSTSPSSGAHDMYPFLFGSTGTELDDSTLDPATAAAMSMLDDPLATTSPLNLDIDLDQLQRTPATETTQQQQEQQQQHPEIKKEEEEAKLDPSLLAMASAAAAAAASLGANVNPSQLLLTPPAEPLTMSPNTATTSLFAPVPATSTKTTPSPNTKSDTSAVRSAKRARSNSLEPSAELEQLASSATAATPKSSSNSSSRKSPTLSAKSTSTTTTTSLSAVKKEAEEVDTATLTSTTNTTLSAATLQFLLQQQAQAPLVPQLFSGTLTREEIDATLAQLLESTKHLLQPDTPPSATPGDATSSLGKVDSDDEAEDMEGVEHSTAPQTHGLKTQPGIKTDDIPSPTDLKKMTSKERRQLRNKISARNFRVRRKEYISTLEGQVQQHKTEARHLREAVTLVQDENQRLKKELEVVKRQLAELTDTNTANALAATTTATSTAASTTNTSAASSTPVADTEKSSTLTRAAETVTITETVSTNATSTMTTTTTTAATTTQAAAVATTTIVAEPIPLSKENQNLLSAIMSKATPPNALHPNAKANIMLPLPRPQSPILLPNYHKDVPNSTSAAAGQGSSWKDKNPILVHRTMVPEVYFTEGFELGDKPLNKFAMEDEDCVDRPWMQLCKKEEEVAKQEVTKSVEIEKNARVHSETAPHLDSMAVLYQVMQTCAWTMWMSSTIGDAYDVLPDEVKQVEQVQEAIEQVEEARALALSYEDVSSQQSNDDAQMLEWLYESMMARLVDLDLQQTQQQHRQHQSAASPTAV